MKLEWLKISFYPTYFNNKNYRSIWIIMNNRGYYENIIKYYLTSLEIQMNWRGNI